MVWKKILSWVLKALGEEAFQKAVEELKKNKDKA